MKKFLNLILFAGIAAGIVFVSGCSEVDEPDPEPAEPVCYMTQEVYKDDFETETTSFEWNSDDQLVKAITGKDTTIFEYSGGRMNRAYDGFSEAVLIYDAGNIPSRINIREDGIDVGYTLLTVVNGDITKAEFHETDGGNDQVTEVAYITYDDSSNVTAFDVDIYDEEQEDFVTFLSGSNIKNDGKKNPYKESFGFIYLNLDNPVALGRSNVTSAQVAISGQNFPYTGTYTYNDNDYPLTSTVTFFIGNTDLTYSYNCK
jgi:hypothetical protein